MIRSSGKTKSKQKKYNQTEKQKRRNKNRRQRNTENSQRILLRPFDSDTNKRTRTRKLSQQIQQKISKDWHPSLTKTFEKKELFQALKSREENKSSGKDGIPMKFYLTFWPIIKKGTARINENSNNFYDSQKMETHIASLR